MNNKQLLTNIRKARVAQDLKQEYVAEQLEISSSTYSKIENGAVKLSAYRLQQIALILNISVAQLIAKNDNHEDDQRLIETQQNDIDSLKQHVEALLQERIQYIDREQSLLQYIRVLEQKMPEVTA